MSYLFDKTTYGIETFKDEWILRDQTTGAPIRHKQDTGSYVDLSNPEYREWALEVIVGWMNQAPYDGIHFDNTNPMGLVPDPKDWRLDWETLIGLEKMAAWNAGLEELLNMTKTALSHEGIVGRTGFVTYNGFARKNWKLNRNLDLLEITDGVNNEAFCYTPFSGMLRKKAILEDIDIQKTYGGMQKAIYQKTSYGDTLVGAEKERVGRYCLGSFWLGYQPGGYNFFKFGPGYDAKGGEIEENSAEIDVNLGLPIRPRRQDAGVLFRRRFENGWVYVNMGDATLSLVVPARLTVMNGGEPGLTYEAGTSYTLPAQDAVFFLKPNLAFGTN